MQGGTTFHFVTDGIESALEQARAAASLQARAWRRRKDVSLGGGASVAQQYLAAGLLDEIVVSVVPILLGGGARLFENVGDVKLEQVGSGRGARGDSHPIRPGIALCSSRRFATVERMTIQRMEHVGIVVDDLEAATAFFVELGLKLQGEGQVEGGSGWTAWSGSRASGWSTRWWRLRTATVSSSL